MSTLLTAADSLLAGFTNRDSFKLVVVVSGKDFSIETTVVGLLDSQSPLIKWYLLIILYVYIINCSILSCIEVVISVKKFILDKKNVIWFMLLWHS